MGIKRAVQRALRSRRRNPDTELLEAIIATNRAAELRLRDLADQVRAGLSSTSQAALADLFARRVSGRQRGVDAEGLSERQIPPKQ